tara:strand:- start:261 stop:782 length:522 start_codon:yes stop_codon:yes gene_type:complete
MSEWLPDDYEIPQSTPKYFKLEQGNNEFRIMSRPILGYEWWEDNAPNRVKEKSDVPKAEWTNERKPKHFWAMVIYNPKLDCFQIFQITQKSIQESISALAKDPDWGSPNDYNIAISRDGEGLETKYSVRSKPKKALDKDVIKRHKETNINLEALYAGDDPFGSEEIKEEDIPF